MYISFVFSKTSMWITRFPFTTAAQKSFINVTPQIPGIQTPFLHVAGETPTPFTMHVEDWRLYSINWFYYGVSKHWIIIQPAYHVLLAQVEPFRIIVVWTGSRHPTMQPIRATYGHLESSMRRTGHHQLPRGEQLRTHSGSTSGLCHFTDKGSYAVVSCSTTAGVTLRNSNGQVRVTVENHGFLQSDIVFHSTTSGNKIGKTAGRWPIQDVALVKLEPSTRFISRQKANTAFTIFWLGEAAGKWFRVDGMSTGSSFSFYRVSRFTKRTTQSTRDRLR